MVEFLLEIVESSFKSVYDQRNDECILAYLPLINPIEIAEDYLTVYQAGSV